MFWGLFSKIFKKRRKREKVVMEWQPSQPLPLVQEKRPLTPFEQLMVSACSPGGNTEDTLHELTASLARKEVGSLLQGTGATPPVDRDGRPYVRIADPFADTTTLIVNGVQQYCCSLYKLPSEILLLPARYEEQPEHKYSYGNTEIPCSSVKPWPYTPYDIIIR